MKYIDFKKWHKENMKNPEFKKGFDALEPEFQMIHSIIRRRIEKDITQVALAKKMRTGQATISRLESGKYNPSIKFLERVAKALDAELKITLTLPDRVITLR